MKTVAQSPAYPMQLMLNIYEFPRMPVGQRKPAIIRRSSWWTTSAGMDAGG
jgi:hypothetical protein